MTYKSRRAYLNAKIHILGKSLAGNFSDVLISSEYFEYKKSSLAPTSKPEIIFPGVSKISNQEAEELYVRMLAVTKESNLFLQTLGISSPGNAHACSAKTTRVTRPSSPQALPGMMSLQQKKAIIKLAKYTFHWSIPATFNYILNTCEHLKNQLSPQDIKLTKINKLFYKLTSKDAAKVIQRLDKINQKNQHGKI